MTQRKEIIGACELYLGDCREILPTLGKVDAVVTDPPYGVNYAANPLRVRRNGMWQSNHSLASWDSSLIDDLPALLAKGRIQVVWGGNYYPLQPSRGWLVWLKPDAPPTMANVELAWTNQDANSKAIQHSIAATRDREGFGHHPTQKPIRVMVWTLEQIGPTASVLDPFMGSGTSGIACVKLGRSFIGIEIDQGYFDIACRRIEAATKQPDLFIEQPKKAEQLNLLAAE